MDNSEFGKASERQKTISWQCKQYYQQLKMVKTVYRI